MRNNISKNKPRTSITHVASLRINAASSGEVRDQWPHKCPGNSVAIDRAVMYYARLPAHLEQKLKPEIGFLENTFHGQINS